MRIALSLLAAAAAVLVTPAFGQTPPHVWIEGEATASANVKTNVAGWGRKEFLSGEQWLHISIDAEKVDADVPGDGVLLAYSFSLPADGAYEVWNRIGFEFVRSPFDWRVDGGEWARVSPDELTSDLMELDQWCEVAWLKLGGRRLAAGPHTLEIRLPKTLDDKGKRPRMLYASDALCISAGTFRPNSRYRPGEARADAGDAEAARQVYELPAPTGATRSSVALNGLWQICRDDEQIPGEVATPIKVLPSEPVWTAIRVPGDKNVERPDLLFAHRVWYRTRVNVPDAAAGRSFHLTFPQNNLNTTVFVNGVYCGFEKNPYCRFQIDVTKAVKPGANEVWVGIRDAWYGYSFPPNEPLKLRKRFNLPISFFGQGFQPLAYPIWNAARSGILNTPEFVCAGPAKTVDVFVKPSVARKLIEADVTVLNTTGAPVSAELACEVIDDATGAVAKSLPAVPIELGAGAEKTVTASAPWTDPKLWWPDAPTMYVLRATLKIAGTPVDVANQPFGFREWGVRGTDFTLNGVPWPVWCDLIGSAATREEWLKAYRSTNQRSMRLMGAAQGGIRWMGMTTDDALDWFDRTGVVVRRSGPLDGEAIGYMAVEDDPALKSLYQSEIKMDLMQNWRDQMVAQVKGERNHPSIMLWSIENEWLYINCINLYGGLMDQFEAEVTKCSDAVRAVDPTRLTMVDGGGAAKNQTLPVHGDHYVFGDKGYDKYPSLAYEPNVTGGGRGRWTWDQKRPRFIGEDFFATGINPADYAIFGGEEAFLGKTEARPAAALVYRMLTEGYRWIGQSAWHFWLGSGEISGNPWIANSPRAVFCRQWDWSFASGARAKRTVGIFNSTHHADPITFTWTLTIGKAVAASGTSRHTVEPGGSKRFDIVIPMPAAARRLEGVLRLGLTVAGKTVFSDTKAVSVLPHARPASAASGLLVFDPHGAAVRFLRSRGVAFTQLASLAVLPPSGRVLLVGKDGLTEAESTSSRLAAWAVSGRRVVILDQKRPLRYQGLPAEVEATDATGQIAFGEDFAHPVLRGLAQKDFFTWPGDMVVYRGAYAKPARGARSLVQCGPRLRNSAIVEAPVGSGLLLLCQMAVGEKLSASPAAQRLLCNLIDHAATYRQEFRPVALAAGSDTRLRKAVDTIGVKSAPAADALAAIGAPGVKLAVISATPANLKSLAANRARVDAFTKGGGYIVLNGLTPEGLADYNRLVGYDHMIRPFWREKVQFPARRHPLTSGLTSGDIVMLSGERIFGWTSDEFVADDEFSYVVDLEDVAPFMSFPNDFAKLMVNGLRNADAWRYIVNLPQKDADWVLKLPKPQAIDEMTWWPNMNYHYATKATITFDGKETRTFSLAPNNEPQTLAISPPVTAQTLRLKITEVTPNPGHTGDITGLDNIALRAVRPPDFRSRVRPMLNIGGMVEYPRGKGGIVLCNLRFKDAETVPVNAAKKLTILGALLRNLNAPLAGSAMIVAGARLRYETIDISKQANQYKNERGWFGDKSQTLADLPPGKQVLAGVPYDVFEFPTSPVPTVVMLGGPGVPGNLAEAVRGIPVGRKADALFFLHTARIDNPINEWEKRDGKQFELCRYVVTYADGTTTDLAVRQDVEIGDYRRKEVTALPGAQLAWTKPYSGTDLSAVVYSMQWNNPRPNAEIRSVDLVYGRDRRGVPALVALTAASAAK